MLNENKMFWRWAIMFEGCKVLYVDELIEKVENEYMFKVEDESELCRIANELNNYIIVVKGRVAMVIDRSADIAIRYIYIIE